MVEGPNPSGLCMCGCGKPTPIATKTSKRGTGTDTTIISPAGWQQTDCVKRTDYQGGVYWCVYERIGVG